MTADDKSISFAAQPRRFALDARAIWLWRAAMAIELGATLALALFGLFFWLYRWGGRWPWRLFVVWCVVAVIGANFVYWYPPRAYRSWKLRLDRQVLETRSGIWFRVVRLLPLTKLQHVDVERGPLERLFGLSSLVLYTAGANTASIKIPALDAKQAMRLRDLLVASGDENAFPSTAPER